VVVYPNKTNTQYIAEAVKNPDGTDKFLFPKNLRGEPKELLTVLTGCKSIEFVHRTGFLAVFNDKQELINFVDKVL
ncbi:MAG: MYG1 family protein, partial [Sulfurihydrogenibium sp.]|nr:MYG1 family protein [Sulfurihydrogenibium sp.]